MAQELKIEQKYFLDPQHALDMSDIYNTLSKFEVLQKNSFGLIKDDVWIYIKITNATDRKKEEVIRFSYPLLDFIDVYEMENKKVLREYKTGDLREFDTRPVEVNDFVIPYTINKNASKEFIFKINSSGTLNVQIDFFDKKSYDTMEKQKTWVLGSYYGAVIIMLIYNFLLYIIIKENVYLHYVLFHFVFLFLQFGLNGLSFQFLWPNTPSINLYYVPIALVVAQYLSIHFTQSFLGIKNLFEKINHYLNFLKICFIVTFFIVLLAPYSVSMKIIALLSAVSPASLFIVGVYILYTQKSDSAKFYVAAWSFTLLGVLLTVFQNLGFLEVSFFTLYGSQMGAFIELSLLSIALAHRYNTVFLNLQSRESELKNLNLILETKVQERTDELNSLNKHLESKVKKSIKQIKENENALRQHTKLVAMGEMIGLIAHQWRQPLATSNIIVSTLQTKNQLDCLEKNYLTKKLYDIEKNNLFMSQTIENFLGYFSPQKNKEIFSPNEAVEQILGLIDNLIKKHHITLKIELEKNGHILGFKDEYIQVVLTLITNAIQAFTEQEEKYITIRSHTKEQKFYLEIIDNAGGIDPNIIHRIFEPYFTTKHQKQGTGLGLYMAKMIIENNMKGLISAQNENNGAKFTIQSLLEDIDGE